ncbi:MAG: AmmeMemoRadiSam system protein A [Anaerolineales bacterium]
MSESLPLPDKRQLLRLARQALEAAAWGQHFPLVSVADLPPMLREAKACFITLMRRGELRGCMGGLQAERALYDEVRHRTAQSALQDYRFPPVSPEEVPEIEIEISVLTELQPLPYDSPDCLLTLLRPGIDGVILAHGVRRATFLPQVWERVPDPNKFLSMLCEKMGLPPDTWRRAKLDVQVYQIEKVTESELGDS